MGIIRRPGDVNGEDGRLPDGNAGLDINVDNSLIAVIISFLTELRSSRVTNSLRMFRSVPWICEFSMEPSSECGMLLYSMATQVG